MGISTSRRPHRNSRPPISYRDESTDDESAHRPPVRSSQRVKRITQSSSDDESAASEELPTRNARRVLSKVNLSNQSQANGSTRRTRRTRRTKDIDYNEDTDEELSETEPEVSEPSRPRSKHLQSRQKRSQPTQPSLKKGPFDAFKRQKTNHNDSIAKITNNKPTPAPVIPPGRIPPWQTLPYQILLSVLQYASYPFYRDASHDTGSITWLIKVSTLSKSFHDAAVATLLYSPPLFPVDLAHGLLRLLSAPQDTLSTPYQNKVKRLDIEVKNLLVKKSGIDLEHLIKQTPLLDSLHLYHNYDRVGAVYWAQPSATTGRSWSYPVELFDTMDESGIRLKEWTWNGRFPDTRSVIDQMNSVASRQCLQGLRSLSIVNLAAPWKIKESDSGTLEESLTTALKALPDLEELNIQNCSILNGKVLSSLPSQLRRLSIINCGNFNSTNFKSYLIEHGYQLEELILNGNQALDLWFAENLQALCPRLRLFTMDLTYSDPSSFHDVDPHYEGVFPDGVMPTWPRALRTINIENLRNLDAGDAESFLRTLIDVAPELKDLRKLSIRILLQADGWRERAKLRQIWMPKLEDVFLRKAAPPAPFIPPFLRRPTPSNTLAPSRPSTSHSTSSSLTTEDSTATTPNKRKSTRIAKRELDGLASFAEVFGMVKPSKRRRFATTADAGIDGDGEMPRQGMCSEVILHIDGQRPADEQFKEADFLDDEVSGDEEWNGRDVVVEGRGRYAW